MKKIILLLFALVPLISSTVFAAPADIWETGQKTCYNTSGIITCTGTGEDGETRPGVAWPNPRFTDNGDGTVTDNLTGLIWLMNATCFGVQTWNQALASANGLASGTCGLSDGSQARDWRLPNRKELLSLVDFEYSNPALSNTAGTAKWVQGNPFANVKANVVNIYLSSTTVASHLDEAWVVDMGSGNLAGIVKTGSGYVWPVRGGQSWPLDNLIISKIGLGTGTVTVDKESINWTGNTGTATYINSMGVTLTAQAAIGSTFAGWSGDPDCTDGQVTMNSDMSCTATFTLNQHTLTINTNPASTGSGTVGGNGTFYYGTINQGTATANAGSTFSGWSGDCSGTASPFAVTMIDRDMTCIATFTLNQYPLTVSKAGPGSGTVNGGGTYNYGTSQQIVATASTGSTFAGWSGDCSGTTSPLSVFIDKAKTCTASFTLNQYALTENKSGTGNGTVGGGGTYDYGTSHDITAVASAGSTFTGWSGDCAGTASPLSVLVDRAKTCTASFTLNQNTLISLQAGWNLFGWITDTGFYTVTTPQSTDYASGAVFTQVATLGDAMTAIGLTGGSYPVVVGPGGKVYVPGSSFNTLTGLMPGMAYWVYMNEAASITLPGVVLPSVSTLAMPGGWIQAAYFGVDGASPSVGFACISGSYDVIVDGSGDVYVPGSPFNTLTNLNQAEGYFIHATGAETLKYSCQ